MKISTFYTRHRGLKKIGSIVHEKIVLKGQFFGVGPNTQSGQLTLRVWCGRRKVCRANSSAASESNILPLFGDTKNRSLGAELSLQCCSKSKQSLMLVITDTPEEIHGLQIWHYIENVPL